MNFLAQKRRGFTYKNMLFALGGWCILLMLIFGVLLMRESFLRKKVSVLKEAVENLNKEKDQMIGMMETIGREQVGRTTKDDLTGILTSRIVWSNILHGLVRNLPQQVWLENVSAKEAEKGAAIVLNVKGKAKSQRDLTNFVMRLESSGMFKQTELVEAKRLGGAENVFAYEINTTPMFGNM